MWLKCLKKVDNLVENIVGTLYNKEVISIRGTDAKSILITYKKV